jgi:hypothetical protein
VQVGGAEASETRVRIWRVALATWSINFVQGSKKVPHVVQEAVAANLSKHAFSRLLGDGLNISRAQTLISNGGWCLLVYYVGVDTLPCCVTSFVYSEDRNDRAVACEWPLFSCRRAL